MCKTCKECGQTIKPETEIRITKPDNSQAVVFRGDDGPERALEMLRQAPLFVEPIKLFDGVREELLTVPAAISRIVDIYWLQTAG